jgi:hypothetical protein
MGRNKGLQVAMLDVSPYLLQMQRHTLRQTGVHFIEANIMDVHSRELQSYDMAILNENLGDLPTLVGVSRKVFTSSSHDRDPILAQVRTLFDRYAIDAPEGERSNVNIGALLVLEKLCCAGIPFVFMSEHSCEAVAPESLQRYIRRLPTGNPERIRLRGHHEYTIRFTDLDKIARALQYRVVRGFFADFLEFDLWAFQD